MTINTFERRATIDEIAAEMDRRGRVIEGLEAERDQWRARENETQDALQKLGEEFGVHGGEPRTSGIRRVLMEQVAYISAIRSELALLRKTLSPFGRCAVVFGLDWADDDEIACEPLAGNGGDGYLLFALRVGDFRAAAELSADAQSNVPSRAASPASLCGRV